MELDNLIEPLPTTMESEATDDIITTSMDTDPTPMLVHNVTGNNIEGIQFNQFYYKTIRYVC